MRRNDWSRLITAPLPAPDAVRASSFAVFVVSIMALASTAPVRAQQSTPAPPETATTAPIAIRAPATDDQDIAARIRSIFSEILDEAVVHVAPSLPPRRLHLVPPEGIKFGHVFRRELGSGRQGANHVG